MGIPSGIGVGAAGTPPSGDQATAVVTGTLTAVGPGDPFAFRGPMNILIYGSNKTALTTTAGSLTGNVVSGTGIAAGAAINSILGPAGTTWATFSGTSGTFALPAVWIPGFVNTSSQQITGLGVTPPGIVGGTVTGPGIPTGTTVISIATPAVAASQFGAATPGIVNISQFPTVGSLFNNQPSNFRFTQTSAAIAAGTDNNAVFTEAASTYSGTVQIERSFDGGQTWIVHNTTVWGTVASFNAGTPVSITVGEPERMSLWRVNCIAYSSGTINYRFSQTGAAGETLGLPLFSG